MAFKLSVMPGNLELCKGNPKFDFIDNIRTLLLHTPRGQNIISEMVPFVDELDAGSPRSPPLSQQLLTYLLNNFPDFVQTKLPPTCYSRTQCASDWMARSVEEKKTARMTVQLSTDIFRTWVDHAGCPELCPEILGAILTVTILHGLAHVLRYVFAANLTPEKLRGSSTTSMMGPGGGGWAWEEATLGEMNIAFTGAGGNWTKVLALGFSKKSKVHWLHFSERGSLNNIIALDFLALQFCYKETFDPRFRAPVMYGGILNGLSSIGIREHPGVQQSPLPPHAVSVIFLFSLSN
ncbi:hypothetical protein K438DRAFT_2024505 [Mycena galopus ATCC 62051]|nr:hypothetical protein K438DRAFT_2024505 [Mycena galopus ATCC 62051]